MNDTTRRFLSAIVDRLPAGGDVVELRLFPAIRQGGIESGVAVVAVQLPEVHLPEDADAGSASADPAAVADASSHGSTDGMLNAPSHAPSHAPSDAPSDAPSHAPSDAPSHAPSDARPGTPSDAITHAAADAASDPHAAPSDHAASPRGRLAADAIASAVHDLVDTDVSVEDEEGSDGDEQPVPVSFIPMADTTGEYAVADALDAELTEIVVAMERDGAPSGETESPYADVAEPQGGGGRPIPTVHGDRGDADPAPSVLAQVADVAAADDEPAIPLADILALPSPESFTPRDGEGAIAAPPQRYAILTAHYRLTLKGPDRGKWEVEITHEADAPLDTVERVARGVAKRAGEASDPEHFSGESLRAALEAPAWATTT